MVPEQSEPLTSEDLRNVAIKISKCKGALVYSAPFYGIMLQELETRVDETCDTLWTDGQVLAYNPSYVQSRTIYQTQLGLKHEALHIANGHNWRGIGKDHDTWQEATDYVVNGILKADGEEIPEGWLYNAEYDGKSADEVYSILYKKKKEKEQNDPNQNQDDKQQPGDDQSGGGSGEGQDDQQEQPGQGEDGQSGGGGSGQGDPGKAGEVRIPTDENGNQIAEKEIEEMKEKSEIKAMQAARMANSFGQCGTGISEMVGIMGEPKVDWKEALAKFVDVQSRNDYTWQKPRQLGNVILPTLYNKELGHIDIWVDVSGSIEEAELHQFASEIESIMMTYNVSCRVIQCDTKVTKVNEFEKNDDVKLTMVGGGGTKFAPAIAYSMAQDELPVCGVYLTDLDAEDFGPEPDFPVLWIQTKGNRAKVPPFGEVVKMYPGL